MKVCEECGRKYGVCQICGNKSYDEDTLCENCQRTALEIGKQGLMAMRATKTKTETK